MCLSHIENFTYRSFLYASPPKRNVDEVKPKGGQQRDTNKGNSDREDNTNKNATFF
jgi:hypothetical protein